MIYCITTGTIIARVRCMDNVEGYSEGHVEVKVDEPTKIDVKKMGEDLETLSGEQNSQQIVKLASSFVETLTKGGKKLSGEEKELQEKLTDKVHIKTTPSAALGEHLYLTKLFTCLLVN